MQNPKVSIILPVYNVEKYLSKCLNSLIKQTYKNLEILIINDGSIDNSLSISKSFATEDMRIKIYNQKNKGLSAARNKGIQHATGEYIYFIDSDDYCEEDIIEKMLNNINKPNIDLCICGYYIDYLKENLIIDKQLNNTGEFIGERAIANAINHIDSQGMLNVVWNKLYKRNILIDYNIRFEVDAMPGEDLIFNSHYMKHIKGISLIADKLYHYIRADEDTLVKKYHENLYEKVQRFNKSRYELYLFYDMINSNFIATYEESYIGYIYSCIPNLYRKNSINYRDRNSEIRKILNDTEFIKIIKKYKPTQKIDKVFKNVLIINNVNIINVIFTILFYLRNNLTNLYIYFRKYSLINR